MKGNKATFDAESAVLILGVILLLFGSVSLINGFNANNPNTVSNGAIIFLVGGAVLAVAKKIF